MAENESLDLPNARRWDAICDDIRRGTPLEKIAPKVNKNLHDVLRKVSSSLTREGLLSNSCLPLVNQLER